MMISLELFSAWNWATQKCTLKVVCAFCSFLFLFFFSRSLALRHCFVPARIISSLLLSLPPSLACQKKVFSLELFVCFTPHWHGPENLIWSVKRASRPTLDFAVTLFSLFGAAFPHGKPCKWLQVHSLLPCESASEWWGKRGNGERDLLSCAVWARRF